VLVVELDERHGHPGARDDLADPCAHRPAADDTDLRNLHPHPSRCDQWPILRSAEKSTAFAASPGGHRDPRRTICVVNRWGTLVDQSRRHHAVCSVRLAADCGLDPSTLRRRAAAERWERLHPGVFALPGSAPSPERRISAALLAVGGHVAACRFSAAYLWGFTDPPDRVDVLLPPGRRAPALDGVRALRSRTALPSDVGAVRGLPVTTPARTLCDLAALVRDDYALRALILAALRSEVLTLGALTSRHTMLRSAPGAARLARVLGRLRATPPTADLGHEIRVFLGTRGLAPSPQPLWVTCPDGRAHRVDVPFLDARVGVLAGDHRDPDELDAAALELTAAGWRVARVSERRFRDEREAWLDGLLRLLATRAGS
jgi:hypothetical protein